MQFVDMESEAVILKIKGIPPLLLDKIIRLSNYIYLSSFFRKCFFIQIILKVRSEVYFTITFIIYSYTN